MATVFVRHGGLATDFAIIELNFPNLQDVLVLFAEFGRRQAGVFLKLAAKMGIVVESDLIANIQGVVGGISKQHAGSFDAQAV